MKALITSGGHGTRLRPITHTQNKHLIPIANKPILYYALENVRDAGVRDVGIITRADNHEVEERVGDGSRFGLRITYIPQEAPLGLAHCVRVARPFLGDEPFLFYLGDNIVMGGVRRFVDEFEARGSACHLCLSRVKSPQRFGVPEIRDGRIVGIEEKPKQPKSDYAVTGIYLYDRSIFEAVEAIRPSARGELEISDAHQYLIDKGYLVTHSEITGWWKDTGKPSDLLEANRLVLDHLEPRIEGDVDEGSVLAGKVTLERGARVKGSVVRGPAIIGPGAVIEDSYIGPFTSVGPGAVVRGSEIEYSVVLEGCRIIDVSIRIESSLLGCEVEIVNAQLKPRTHRFVLGDQSRIEVA